MLTPGKSMGGRYRLDERIATGGMGDVWKCEDTVLGRVVALKVLQPAMLEEPGFAERFRAEARVMATINHPGVVSVYDYGENPLDGGGSVAYLVMEYVEGEPLHRVLGNVGRLVPQRTMDLIAQAADALQAAHDHGIIHRDVKPGNLLVRPNGQLVLTDFGIARSAMTGNLTQAGAVLGTASYVSPEQASGSGAITPASDVYSLGVVAYQCLAGRRPFEGDNPIEVAMRHVRDEPPPLPPDVPENARAVVGRAMAKDVAQRWPDAKTMGEAARTAAAGRPVSGALGAAAAATSVLGATSPAAATPGGTSVMPAVPGGTRGGPGNQWRGAASVPSGPSQIEDDYYGGGYGGDGDHPTGEPRKRKGPLIAGVVAGVIVLLLGIGLLAYALSGDRNKQPNTDKSPAVATVTVDKDEFIGDPVDDAVKRLNDMGLDASKQEGAQDGAEENAVTDLSDSGKMKKGDKIVVYYQPEQEGGMPTFPGRGDDDETEEPDDDPTTDDPTTQPPTSEPPPSDPPTTSSPQSGSIGGGFGGTNTQKDD